MSAVPPRRRSGTPSLTPASARRKNVRDSIPDLRPRHRDTSPEHDFALRQGRLELIELGLAQPILVEVQLG